MQILAADIGGTKTNIALFEPRDNEINAPVAQKSFPSGGYPSLEAIVGEFLRAQPGAKIDRACFGIAGPVVGGTRVESPNLAWHVHVDYLTQVIGVNRVKLINDLEATAHGIGCLGDEQLHALNPTAAGGAAVVGNRALIAAGTGLGMAGLFWDGTHHRPLASEGGHSDFAPRGEREIELLRYLAREFGGHVSYERVLSGPGLYNVYSFLRSQHPDAEPSWLADEIKQGDKSAAVSMAALAGKADLAVAALDMFVEVYGAMSGNLALMFKAFGGVYIGGGIAPKIVQKLKDGTFMRAFADKGRMSSLVTSMPVFVILDDKTALYGAARCALNDLG